MAGTRDEILEHARELYLEEGAEGFSMREVARRVGVTAPALYRHFESRADLLATLVEEAYGTLLGYLHRALEGEGPAGRFRLAGRAYLEFALDQPRLYQVLYAAPDVLSTGELPEETAAHACAIGQFWNDRVRECVDAGLLRGDVTPEEVSVTLWAHAHGLLSLHLVGMLDDDAEAFRATYGASSRRVLQGLATPGFAAALGRAGGRDAEAATARPEGAGRAVAGGGAAVEPETPGVPEA